MKKIVYMGIDPGINGGLAIMKDEEVKVYDCPEGAVNMAKVLYSDVKGAKKQGYRCIAIIEKVHSMPKQGVASTFTFGTNYGMWLGILAAYLIPVHVVTPNKWQKSIIGFGKKDTKIRSLEMARRLFPKIDLTRKKDHNKADALLLTLYLKSIVKELEL